MACGANNTWERAVARELGPACAAGFGVFLSAMLTGQIIKLGDAASWLMPGSFGATVALAALGYALPPLVGVLLPMAWLFACLFVLSRQSEERELLALAQMGRSPAALYRVPLWGGCAVALVASFVLVFGEPWGARHLRALFATQARLALVERLVPNTFHSFAPGVTLFVDEAKGGGLAGIFLSDLRHEERPLVIDAVRGRIAVEGDGSGARPQATLELEGGRALSTPLAKDAVTVVTFERGVYRLDMGPRAGKQRLSVTAMQEEPFASLWQSSRSLSCTGGAQANAGVTLQRKFAFPAAAIVFAAVAVGLSVGVSRGARGKSVAYSAALIAGYYACGRSLELMARAGTLAPAVAAWLPNAVGTAIAWALWRLRVRGGR